MPIDAGIYNVLNTKAPEQISNAFSFKPMDAMLQGKLAKNKLAQLAQQQELQSYQLNAAKRAEAAVPQQQADAQRARDADYMRGVSSEIASNPDNADAIMQKHAQLAQQMGIDPNHITWLAQDLSTAKTPEELQQKAFFHSLTQEQQAKYQLDQQARQHSDVIKEFQGGDGKMYGLTRSEVIPLEVNGQQIPGTVAPTDYNKPFNADGSPNVAFQNYQRSLKPPKEDNSKPPAGYRFTVNGDLQAIPGGPADIKEQAKSSAQETGRSNVSSTIAQLRDAYSQINQGGGITDPNAGSVHNLIAGIGSSGAGQFTGKMLGTQNQSKRNEILMTRPS